MLREGGECIESSWRPGGVALFDGQQTTWDVPLLVGLGTSSAEGVVPLYGHSFSVDSETAARPFRERGGPANRLASGFHIGQPLVVRSSDNHPFPTPILEGTTHAHVQWQFQTRESSPAVFRCGDDSRHLFALVTRPGIERPDLPGRACAAGVPIGRSRRQIEPD